MAHFMQFFLPPEPQPTESEHKLCQDLCRDTYLWRVGEINMHKKMSRREYKLGEDGSQIILSSNSHQICYSEGQKITEDCTV